MPVVQNVSRRERLRRGLRAPAVPAPPGLVARAQARLRAAVADAARRLDLGGRLETARTRAARPLRLAAFALLVPAVAWHFLLGPEGYLARRRLDAEIRAREVEIVALEARALRTTEEVQRMREDPAESERAVRDELGLVRPNETVYRVVEEPPAAPARGWS